MILLPVLTRELLVGARKQTTYRARVIASAVTIGMAIWLMLFSNSALGPAEQGKFFLTIFTWLAFLYCLFAGANSTSDCISQEKRDGTLGLLFLTDLRTLDLLIGKIAATSLHHLYTLMAMVPMLALCLLMGGVTGTEVFFIAVVLLNTLFFSICAGALVSTFSIDQRKAMFGTGVLVLAALGLPFLFEILYYGDIEKLVPSDPLFLQASPLFPFLVAVNPVVFNKGNNALVSIILIHLLGWIMLMISAWALPRRIHDSSNVKTSSWANWTRRLLFGDGDKKAAYRRKLLDQNAYFWLAAQEKAKANYSWMLVAVFAAIFFASWISWKDLAVDSPFPMFLMIAFHGLYKLWMASEVSSRLVEDRRVGAFELLLSTSITPKEMMEGLHRALWRQFSKPIGAMLLLDFFIMYSMLSVTSEIDVQKYGLVTFLVGLFVFFVDLYSLKWLAAWHSLFSNKQGKVLSRLGAQVLMLPWVLTILTGFFLLFAEKVLAPRSGFVSYGNLLVIWVAFSLLLSLLPARAARASFLSNLRTIAANRFDSVDKGSIFSLLYARFTKAKEGKQQPFWIRHWALTGCLVIFLCLAVGFTWRQWKWRNAVLMKIAEIKSMNMPVNSRDLAAMKPFIPANKNGAVFLEQAAMLSPAPVLSPGLTYRNGLFSEPMPLNENLPPLVLSNVVQLEKQNRAALQLLSAITNYPAASIDTKWTHPWSPYERRVVNTRNMAAGVEARGLLEIERGNLVSASQNLHQLLLIYKFSLEFHSFQMQHLRREMVMKMAQLCERLVSKGVDIHSGEITQAQALLKDLDNPSGIKNSLLYVRAYAIEIGTNSVSSIIGSLFTMARGPEEVLYSAMMTLERKTGTMDKKLFTFLEQLDRAVAMCDSTNYVQQLVTSGQLDSDSEKARTRNFYPAITSFFTPYYQWLLNEHQFQIAKLRLMKTLLAVEKERSLTGRIPPDLSDTSKFPLDPFTSKPFLIKTNDSEYYVYSLGMDMTDNGGAQVAKDRQRENSDITIRRLLKSDRLSK
ncbi:MAG: hypothetical protein ACO1QB_01010 [Verrucomicrobiales bacterium]